MRQLSFSLLVYLKLIRIRIYSVLGIGLINGFSFMERIERMFVCDGSYGTIQQYIAQSLASHIRIAAVLRFGLYSSRPPLLLVVNATLLAPLFEP